MSWSRTAARSPAPRRALATATLLVLAVSQASAMPAPSRDELTPSERRGKDIYFGTATGIRARVGTPPVEAPAALLACANCHGAEGRGQREGGVAVPDIRWETLTKPYGVTRPSGRTTPPYTERLLVRAVALGVDAAGRPLHAAMPRFQISRADMEALTQYLKRMSTETPAGLSDSEIRLATIAPVTGPLATAGAAVNAVLSAYVETLNAEGGIYGRRLALRSARIGQGADAASSMDAFIRDAAPLAIVGGLVDSTSRDAIAIAESRKVPYVAPLTILPESVTSGGTTFYLLPGVEQQARALLEYCRGGATASSSDAGGPSLAIVHSSETVVLSLVERIQDYANRHGWRAASVDLGSGRVTQDTWASQFNDTAASHVLLLIGGDQLAGAAAVMASLAWKPTVLIPGSLATDDLLNGPPLLLERILVALPSVPSDQTPSALDEYRRLAATYHLPSSDLGWQLVALGSAKLLTHALRLAGRGVTRATLVTTLESLSDFDTGLMPRLGFSRARRIGAPGCYIATIDPARKRFKPMTGWLRVN